MPAYAEVIRALGDEPGFVAVTILHAAIAALSLALAGTWLPLVVLGRRRAGNSEPGENLPPHHAEVSLLEMLVLSLGGGLVLAVAAGTASAFLAKNLTAGVWVAAACGACTTLLLIARFRGETRRLGIGGKMFTALSVITLILALWHHTITAMPINSPAGPATAFTSLHFDNGFHCFLAAVLGENGLPLRDLHGSPTQAFGAVTHTGHGVLISMLATVLQTNVFRASTALWIVSLLLLVWALAALLTRCVMPKVFVFLGSVAPLFLGPVTMPPLVVLTEPLLAMNLDPLVAGRMHWNLPQAISTAMAAVGLVSFDRYCRSRNESEQVPALIGTAVMFAVSAWVKPSLAVFFGPALFIVLLLQRARVREFGIIAAVFLAAAAIYLLPAWLVPVAKHPAWSFRPGFEQTQHVLGFVLLGGGAVLLLSLAPLRDLFKGLFRRMEPSVLILALIAMGGSVLFALLFREDRFVSRPNMAIFQPNLWWGASACVVLLFPLALRSAVERMLATNQANWFVIAGLMLALLQVGSGMMFAIAYPAIIGRLYPERDLGLLTAARIQTPPLTRFLIDPKLTHPIYGFSDLAGWLARPSLFATNYLTPEEQGILESWSGLFAQPAKQTDTSWAQYDAAILSTESKAARGALKQQGWTSENLSEQYELWRRSATSETQQP